MERSLPNPTQTEAAPMTASPETLKDRMLARVKAARRDVDRRTSATRPKVRRGQPRPADPGSPDMEETRETQSLKRVFRELGTSYRRYRKQTGDPVVPALRDAAYNFRADPSLASLIIVAGFLDELNLLD
jgi:hypothetical protein